ncbi:sensor histidine kinase [Desulfosporosinus fructosivorans]|nr:HAMP domain-containing sensor histidine kinase [Desulfosporosinus fructosivorans]
MLRNSVRAQIGIAFTIIVLISLFFSFGITRLLSEREVSLEQRYLTIARDTASLLALTDSDRREQVLDLLSTYNITGEFIKEGGELPFSLTEEKVSPLYQAGLAEPLFLNTEQGPIRLIGVPNIDNSGSSLILKVDFTVFSETMLRILLISLFSVLVIGTLLILLASHYIVEPVKRLTSAAKEMAKGNLSFRIEHKKKDEIGELMDSFNHMASELEKIDKMRESFVSNVSHEIQSPITAIRGFTRAISDGIIPAENQKEYLEIIYQETLRLSKLSDNLLRLASLDSENHPFHPARYRLDEQLRKMILATEPLWADKNLEIELDLQAFQVTVDQDLFEQVWQNLINNAIKYSDEKGRIEVIMEVDNQAVFVHIKNNGKVIPKIDLPHIFDRFYMVDKARSHSGGGNGLGLSIVKKIVELHSSKIDVISNEAEGTCFTVSMPL